MNIGRQLVSIQAGLGLREIMPGQMLQRTVRTAVMTAMSIVKTEIRARTRTSRLRKAFYIINMTLLERVS